MLGKTVMLLGMVSLIDLTLQLSQDDSMKKRNCPVYKRAGKLVSESRRLTQNALKAYYNIINDEKISPRELNNLGIETSLNLPNKPKIYKRYDTIFNIISYEILILRRSFHIISDSLVYTMYNNSTSKVSSELVNLLYRIKDFHTTLQRIKKMIGKKPKSVTNYRDTKISFKGLSHHKVAIVVARLLQDLHGDALQMMVTHFRFRITCK